MRALFILLKLRLSQLSARTGIIVLLCCIPFYLLSFAQFLLPMSKAAHGFLWVMFFGFAKATQYGGLTILGADGIKHLKSRWKRKEL